MFTETQSSGSDQLAHSSSSSFRASQLVLRDLAFVIGFTVYFMVLSLYFLVLYVRDYCCFCAKCNELSTLSVIDVCDLLCV